MQYVRPVAEQSPCGPRHKSLLLGESTGRKVCLGQITSSIEKGARPVGNALPNSEWDHPCGSIFLDDVRKEDQTLHLSGRVGSLGDDQCVVAEVAVVALVIVDPGVLGPELGFVETE